MADLYGPDGKPIVRHNTYKLGPSAITTPGSPNELFAVFEKTQIQGGVHGQDLAPMVIATWAHASVAISEAMAHGNDLAIRVAAMERVLARHSPEIHAEYIAEIGAVQQEMTDAAVLANAMPKEGMH